MRLATFETSTGDGPTMGAYVNEHYVDLHGLSNAELPDNMIGFLQLGEEAWAEARRLLRELDGIAAGQAHVYAAGSVMLHAPVPRPGKIIHTACNFDAHLDELTSWEQPEWQSSRHSCCASQREFFRAPVIRSMRYQRHTARGSMRSMRSGTTCRITVGRLAAAFSTCISGSTIWTGLLNRGDSCSPTRHDGSGTTSTPSKAHQTT